MAKLSDKIKGMEARTYTFPPAELCGLADYVEGGEGWTVRGLTANEIFKANNLAKAGREVLDTLVDGLTSKQDAEKLRKALMPKDEIETRTRQEQLSIASVDPAIDIRQARAVSEKFPVEFIALTTKILELSGQGAVEKKHENSGANTVPA